MFASYCLTFWFVAWIALCSGDDVVVQMFSKKPINYISEKYISYSIDPTELLEMKKEDGFVYRMLESGPCYLKIYGNNTNKMRLDGNSIDLNSSKLSLDRLKNVYDVLRSADIKPVIALPYEPKNWNTRNVMRILGKVSLLDMNDIIWQLGADFHAKDAISYIDDLNTLKLIVGAFATKENKKNWSVVGSDITLGSSEDEARMYSEFSKYIVEAVGWSQSIELSYSDENVDDFFSHSNIDPALRTILNGESPVWLSLLQKNADSKNPLTHMKQALNWAQILGDSAKNGFKVIYAPIKKQTWYEPSMSYYTTLLHKRIIGQTVFDTKMFNGNRFDTHFYAHCTKNMSGSFTLFGVNAADSSLDITAKLPFRSGTEYMEFILTVGVNGKVYLNGAEIIEPTVLTPAQKYKLPGKGALISMPAHSVAFWVFTGASIPECTSIDAISFETEQTQQRTSSELLLQQLIVETVTNDEQSATSGDENSIPRSKRNAIAPEDFTNNRIRRDTENNIEKHSEYNAIEMNVAVSAESQARDKRFIGDGKFSNRISNDMDDLKRRNFGAAYKTKLITKRMKRDINMLKNLFDKFDLKKTAFNFKTPSLVRGGKGLISSVSTVHDVLNPGSVEKKIFEHVENPGFPSGDIHFEIAAAVTEPNEYAAALNAANKIVEKTPVSNPPTVDWYGSAGLASPSVYNPSLSNAVPSSVLLGELTELDMVTVAPVSAPAPAPVSVHNPSVQVQPMQQTIQPVQPAQHQLQFVVKDLPPTWQVNRANMEKARDNLRQNLWPMSMNAHNVNPKTITAFLPNVAQLPNLQPDEHILFESKRRRRAIDSKMNDEIERRVRRGKIAKNDQTNEHGELLEKLMRLLDDLELSHAYDVSKSGNGIAKRFRSGKTMSIESDVLKKCKVVSMAMEKQCLEDESQPKTLFKRAIESKLTKSSGPLKKFLAKIKDTVDKPLKFRTRRSTNDIDEPIHSDENKINTISKELNDKDINVPRKNVYQKHQHEMKQPITSTETPTTEEKVRPDIHNPKVLRAIGDSMNNIMNTFARHIAQVWDALT